MPKIVRSHDAFYLNEDRYENTKESFKFLGELMLKQRKKIVGDATHGNTSSISISDWGCATGEFPFYLRKIFPADTIVGYELLPELVNRAVQKVEGVQFVTASILDRKSSPGNSHNLTCANGILSIFDDFVPVLENLIHWTKPGGSIFVDGLFNNDPLDVNIKYNLAENYGTEILECGWNIFSKKSIENFLLTKSNVSSVNFFDFEMPIDLLRQPDPVRTWTEKREDGTRYQRNGLCIIQPQSVLKIDLKQ